MKKTICLLFFFLVIFPYEGYPQKTIVFENFRFRGYKLASEAFGADSLITSTFIFTNKNKDTLLLFKGMPYTIKNEIVQVTMIPLIEDFRPWRHKKAQTFIFTCQNNLKSNLSWKTNIDNVTFSFISTTGLRVESKNFSENYTLNFIAPQ